MEEDTREVVPLGSLRLVDDSGKGTLELIHWRQEAAVLVDGKYILRRSVLVRALADATERDW